MNKIMILGGYGNFGKRIANALVSKGLKIIIVGRTETKARQLATQLGDLAAFAVFDVNQDLSTQIKTLKPQVIINTCGPFQLADYSVAQTCIDHNVHYIDLADGRNFVTGITTLDTAAKKAGVSIISGASTVPGLSSAVVEKYKNEFSIIHSMIYGISPGQKAERGLATTKGIMSYVGKVLAPFKGTEPKNYGWQGIYRQEYPSLGKRWMANCDIPDLDLLPKKYAIGKIKFSAGLELPYLHLGLWALSWLVRIGLPLNLPKFSKSLLVVSDWFNRFGSADGGMHVILSGLGLDGKPHTRKWFIIAKGGDGPHIPTIPAIILAQKLATKTLVPTGAMPCVGLVGLDEYLNELAKYAVEVFE